LPRLSGDQAIALQLLERAAHGHPGHAMPLRQLAFGRKELPTSEASGSDFKAKEGR
jgi:hypothetical protein